MSKRKRIMAEQKEESTTMRLLSSPFCFEFNAINPRGSGGLVPQSKQHSL